MDSWFDEMTKLFAEGIPRRKALGRLAGLCGTALLPASAFAQGDPYDLGCNCKDILVGHDLKGGFDTEDDCKQNGIPPAYKKA